MELICTFPPYDSESGHGYYRRLASENVLASWKDLARECEVSISRPGLLAQPEYIADRLGLKETWARQASLQEEIARGWHGLRRSAADAVCPVCLAESPFIRLAWEHVYSVACARHGVQLLDHCEDCGDRFSPNRERIDACQCGSEISAMSSAAATPARLWLASLIATQGASSGTWLPMVTSVPVDMVAHVVRTLCLHQDPAGTPPRQNAAAPRTVLEAVQFLHPLDALLAEWPAGFEAHVSERMAAGNPEARTLNALLGTWYLRLKGYAADNSCSQFIDAIGRVAAREFNGLVGLDTAAQLMSKSRTHLRASEAAKVIGVHRETLVARLQAGQVAHRTKKFGSRGVTYEIPVEEVEAIRQARSEWISVQAASSLLGVPPTLVERMVHSGIVQSDLQWRRDVLKGGPVSQKSVLQMISAIKSHRARAPQDDDAGRISLGQLSGRRVGDQTAMARAVRAIVAGEIRPIARAEKAGEFVYSMTDVGRYFSTPMLEAGLSIQALSKLTGWKWETISHWIDSGLLSSCPITLRGQPSRVVMPAQLLEFCRKYLPLSDVAKQVGTKSSALAEKLQGIEVIGAKPLAEGQRRGGLLRIADLAEMAVAGSKAMRQDNV